MVFGLWKASMTSCWGLGVELFLLYDGISILIYPHCRGCPWWVWQLAVSRTMQWMPWPLLGRAGRWSCFLFEPVCQGHDSDFTANWLHWSHCQKGIILNESLVFQHCCPKPCMHLSKPVLWLGWLGHPEVQALPWLMISDFTCFSA